MQEVVRHTRAHTHTHTHTHTHITHTRYAGDAEGRGGIYNFVTKRGLCAGNKSKISWTQVGGGGGSGAAAKMAAAAGLWPGQT